jgi:hypothetical protein
MIAKSQLSQWAKQYLSMLPKGNLMPSPQIIIVNKLSVSWDGHCEFKYSSGNSVIQIQKRLLIDEESAKRVIAHEICHHWAFRSAFQGDVSERDSEGHGSVWMRAASVINGHTGSDFVTEKTDSSYTRSTDSGKEFYVYMVRLEGRICFGWFARVTDRLKLKLRQYINHNRMHGVPFTVIKTQQRRLIDLNGRFPRLVSPYLENEPEFVADLNRIFDETVIREDVHDVASLLEQAKYASHFPQTLNSFKVPSTQDRAEELYSYAQSKQLSNPISYTLHTLKNEGYDLSRRTISDNIKSSFEVFKPEMVSYLSSVLSRTKNKVVKLTLLDNSNPQRIPVLVEYEGTNSPACSNQYRDTKFYFVFKRVYPSGEEVSLFSLFSRKVDIRNQI